MIKISVIVPCYKQAQYLSETLESVMNQTYTDWECIIVDDGSPDNTKEVAQKWCVKDNRFHYLYKENGGLASARNFGIRQSNGEFILPLDSDDKIAPTYMEKAMRLFTEDTKIKLVYPIVEQFGVKTGVWNIGEYQYDDLIWYNMIVCTCFYRRADFDKTSGYNSNMKYGYEDWDFLLSLLQPDDKVVRIPEVMFYYRRKPGSMVQQMGSTMEYTLHQIALNHPNVYAKYIGEIVWLQRQLTYYKYGLPYKLGSKLLKPYRKLKQILTNHHYMDY